jgi:hypothetical protein
MKMTDDHFMLHHIINNQTKNNKRQDESMEYKIGVDDHHHPPLRKSTHPNYSVEEETTWVFLVKGHQMIFG